MKKRSPSCKMEQQSRGGGLREFSKEEHLSDPLKNKRTFEGLGGKILLGRFSGGSRAKKKRHG